MLKQSRLHKPEGFLVSQWFSLSFCIKSDVLYFNDCVPHVELCELLFVVYEKINWYKRSHPGLHLSWVVLDCPGTYIFDYFIPYSQISAKTC